jgi:hypothetical protein
MPGIGGRRRPATVLALLLVGAGLLMVARGVGVVWSQWMAPAVEPTVTFQARLIPSATPFREATAFSPQASTGPRPTIAQVVAEGTANTATAAQGSTPTPAATALPSLLSPTRTVGATATEFSVRQRFGVVAPRSDVDRFDVGRLGAGWYLQSATVKEPARPGGMEALQFVGVQGGSYSPDAASLQDIARHNPGTLWVVGNEPDVIWQSNATPQEYAQVYHDAYHLLKEADPACQVAIGAIAQVTPLRLGYLEQVLAAYREFYGEPMPVDVWNIHVAILREERGSWGVDIPPGQADDAGILYEIGDNANVEILKQQVVTFRRWMAEQGLRDRTLIVTEFSVLMPAEYGFPPGTVRDFMIGAFDFFLNARDGDIGRPADGNRLVQRWAWYSVADTDYATGNLFDPDTGQMTPLGKAFADYVAGISP